MQAARAVYDNRCAPCHGTTGAGDGPQAATTKPRPQRLTDPIWQSNVTNARLSRVILLGGGAVGKSTTMPASPELRLQPQVVQGLVALIRSFTPPTVP